MLLTNKKKKVEKIFREYYPLLCLYANKYLGDMAKAEDVVSQFFCEALEKDYLLNVKSSLSAYMYTSVRNACLKSLKESAKLQHGEEEVFEHTYAFEQESDFTTSYVKDPVKRVHECIAGLPPQARLIFEMSRFGDMKYREIAEELSISVKTVETQMSRALKKLRQLYFEKN